MTVSTTTTKNSYSGNGTLHSFAYGFKIFADADLSVVVRNAAGAETTKTLNTHYIVTNAGTDTGGNVLFKFNTGTSSDAHHSTSDFRPASGETVVISRALTLTQGTDYVANDPFPANSHENALDRLTMIQQQQQEELDRTIKASVTNTISGAEFTTSASDRANKLLSFDGSGDLTVTEGKVDTVSVSVSGLSTGASPTGSATFTASSGALALALGIPAGATGATGPTGGGMANVVEDTSPQLGANLDTNSHNILIDDAHFIADESGNEQIVFQTTGSAVNHLEVTNNASGSNPILGAAGDDTNIGIALTPKGTGEVVIGASNLNYGGTAVTSTGAEINLIAGGTARGTTALADGDGLLVNDAGTMRMTNVQTVKTYMTAGVGGGGTEFIASSGAISNAANVSFTQFDATKYDHYAFYFQHVVPATDHVVLFGYHSTDGGSNYDTTSGEYHYFGNTDTSGFILSYINQNTGSDSGEYGVSGLAHLYAPHVAAFTMMSAIGLVTQSSNGGIYGNTVGQAGARLAAEDTDAIQFAFSSGNIESGEIVMYGIKNA